MKKKGKDLGILESGPFKGKRLEMAPSEGIEGYRDLAFQLILRVFGIDAMLLTDESSLWDFCDFGSHDSDTEQQVFAKIKEIYDLDVSDIQDGNLLAVCQRIARLSLNAPKPKDSH